MMEAGSLKSIAYAFFLLVDAILHAFDSLVGNAEWRYRFCQWAHRRDLEEVLDA